MDLNASLVMKMTTTAKKSASELPGAGDRTTVFDQFDSLTSLSGSSTPAITKKYINELTGTQNLDLTALSDPQDGTVDASGLKLQALIVNNESDSDDLVISDGVANAYSINDGSDITIPPGGKMLLYFADQLADVAAGAKAIDFTPGAGETFQVGMLFG